MIAGEHSADEVRAKNAQWQEVQRQRIGLGQALLPLPYPLPSLPTTEREGSDPVATWVPMQCPWAGCGYIAQVQMTDVTLESAERTSVIQALQAEHPDHPGELDEIPTNVDPVAED